ncbi:hypothetical protein DFH27DRAFT_605065 [Peziza echinospora]|nr:hypothetical protein DFH27DRAFT_605065 [Peziza echinospora]
MIGRSGPKPTRITRSPKLEAETTHAALQSEEAEVRKVVKGAAAEGSGWSGGGPEGVSRRRSSSSTAEPTKGPAVGGGWLGGGGSVRGGWASAGGGGGGGGGGRGEFGTVGGGGGLEEVSWEEVEGGGGGGPRSGCRPTGLLLLLAPSSDRFETCWAGRLGSWQPAPATAPSSPTCQPQVLRRPRIWADIYRRSIRIEQSAARPLAGNAAPEARGLL